MRQLRHPNVVELKHCFYAKGDKVRLGAVSEAFAARHHHAVRAARAQDELYLNLVLEFVPETVYRINRQYVKRKQYMPVLLVKVRAVVSPSRSTRADAATAALRVPDASVAGVHPRPWHLPPRH